ncbi:MAG: hypothetical protein Q9191_007845 [Dirinaria sp. TL-2023a]
MDEIWKNSVRKGTFLYDQMQSGCFPDKQNPPTFSELRAQNWRVDNAFDPRSPPFPPRPVAAYLSPPVVKFMTVPEYTSLPETAFDSQYSLRNRLINALIMIKRKEETLHWSDVTFAVWEYLSDFYGSSVRNLRYVAYSWVDNVDSMQIMEAAVQDPYKVAIFEPGTEAYLALLGTPNAIGSAYLLMEHKKQLGHKSVGRIFVFSQYLPGEELGYPTLVLEFVDVPAAPAAAGLGANRLMIGNQTDSGLYNSSSHEHGCGALFHGLVANA